MKRQKIIIVGSGLAAYVLASKLWQHNDVTILTKNTTQHSNSIRAQGGIAAAIAAKDQWQLHVEDTLKAGVFHNHQKAVETLVKEGKQVVTNLLQQGFLADRDHHGELLLGREGAHSERRIIHAGGDQTGKYLIYFYQQLLQGKIAIIEGQLAVECVMEGGECKGIMTMGHDNQLHTYTADHIVLATGGFGALYDTTSNDPSATGDGIAIAYRAGAKVSDLEFVQFHPTMLATQAPYNDLISEAVRGEGAILVDQNDREIMKGAHPLENLAPRDIVARVMMTELTKGHQLYLDIHQIKNFQTKFPFIKSVCEKNNIDWQQGLIPVKPGAHFTMGGVETDLRGRTNIPRLYAIGEVACTHVHGANRLASNSLLEGMVFATRLADYLTTQSSVSFSNIPVNQRLHHTFHHPDLDRLRKQMTNHVGINRSESGLKQMTEWLEKFTLIQENHLTSYVLSRGQIQMQHHLLVAQLVTKAARKRLESRGAHYRVDYPFKSEQWRNKSITFQLTKQGVTV
ncbi:L-aspartate oxidase [Gracilibacillus suaedae]|uniref:L-aspartate oxidase n=1 Tax=Gracilibacillus suaedae TaxID=2820273 RepID=UPI001ABEA451|nr:L-aspartate oxidase [Gracilibacillus suaedae]